MAQERGVCGIELGKDAVAIVHYLPSDNAVTTYGSFPLDNSPVPWWQSVTEEIKPLVRDLRANGQSVRGEYAVCSLPAEHAVVSKLMIDANEDDPYGALSWELGQRLVGSPDEYAYDFQKLHSVRPAPVATYLAAAYRSSWTKRVDQLARRQRLVPRALDLDIFALINVFEANYRDIISRPALLVLGGRQCTKVVLTWNGSLVDYEFFRFGTDAREPAEYASTIQAVITRLRASYQALAGRDVPPVLATGAVFTDGDFSSACFDSVDNMQMLNPFRNLGTNAIPESRLREAAPRVAIAVGLAVRESMELMA
ncbi:MAG: hypothetical protein GF331_19605 [Chitinivibrionales bacterium]|nr:hypothetical protein [Chitinivibrionales bacterium]